MGNKIEVSITQGLHVPNIFKNVPNFVKNVLIVPRFVSMWEMTFNHYLRVLKG